MGKKHKRRVKRQSRARVRARRGQRSARPELTENDVLAWADAFYAQTGRWPTARSGPVAQAPGENWSALNDALRSGSRGLPGGSSLFRLLAAERGARNPKALPSLTRSEIIRWADLYHDRHGTWPKMSSGPIPEVAGETWKRVNASLIYGTRGLPGRSTLKRLLWEYRGVNYYRTRGPFTVEAILAWADAHHARTGNWPDAESGRIPECPGGAWDVVEIALVRGSHGLPGGSQPRTLARRAPRGPESILRARPDDSPDPRLGRSIRRANRSVARAEVWPHSRGARRNLARCPARPPRRHTWSAPRSVAAQRTRTCEWP